MRLVANRSDRVQLVDLGAGQFVLLDAAARQHSRPLIERDVDAFGPWQEPVGRPRVDQIARTLNHARLAPDREWHLGWEADGHPRDAHGQFTAGAGGADARPTNQYGHGPHTVAGNPGEGFRVHAPGGAVLATHDDRHAALREAAALNRAQNANHPARWPHEVKGSTAAGFAVRDSHGSVLSSHADRVSANTAAAAFNRTYYKGAAAPAAPAAPTRGVVTTGGKDGHVVSEHPTVAAAQQEAARLAIATGRVHVASRGIGNDLHDVSTHGPQGQTMQHDAQGFLLPRTDTGPRRMLPKLR